MSQVIDKYDLTTLYESIEDIQKQPIQTISEIAKEHAFPFRVIRVCNFSENGFWAKENAESTIEFIKEEWWVDENNLRLKKGTNNINYNEGFFQGADIKAYKVLKG